ncbi:MAG: HlyC/CorC family transporter [Hyphomonadaceae bacterium]|nr:HlyC/CorC family transporter [Hyphomonadaceae bacterium]
MPDSADPPEPGAQPHPSAWRRFTRRLLKRKPGTAEEAVADLHEHARVTELDPAKVRVALFADLKVEDVMRPRADIVGVEASATLGEAVQIFSDSQHSRLPIYRDTLDDPLGFVHVRDVMSELAPNDNGEMKTKLTDRPLTRLKREILFVPASMKLAALFLKMQASRIHLALVVDEYGGTDGIVSMEDLVEQIVGQIEDEHDVESALLQVKPGGVVEADGRAEIKKLETAIGASLALEDHEDDYDTAGGLAAALAGRVPQRGEILRHPAGFDVEIIDADPRRVKRVRVLPAREIEKATEGGA